MKAVALESIRAELNQVLPVVKVSVEVIPGQVDRGCTDFQRTRSPQGQDCYWIPWTEALGAWITAEGRAVVLAVSQGLQAEDLAAPLANGLVSVIVGACLNLSGTVAIHANAVNLENRAVAFIGYSGAGKSTLSAFCLTQGAELLTDDVLRVDAAGNVYPGLARLKLYPETAAELGFSTTRTTPYKLHYHPIQIGGSLAPDAIPVGLLYLLAESPNQQIYTESIAPSQAVFELLSHSYYATNLIPERSELLDAYANLVEQAPVRRLFYPRDLTLLPQVYNVLRQEMRLLFR
ncbi:MAG: hypothetical protein ACKO7W_13735 [Elainella sp.]